MNTTLVPESRYFERMSQSLGDKARILDHLLPGNVLDVGAGGGDLSRAMLTLPSINRIFAVDKSLHACTHMALDWEPNDRLNIMQYAVNELRTVFRGYQLDNIVLSSVLHEVFSFGGNTETERWTAWNQAIDICTELLRPGGRLVIRDGVQPFDPDATTLLAAPDENANRLLMEYVKLSPFDKELLPTHCFDNLWFGPKHVMVEAMLTVNWGKESLPRESQERVALMPLDNYTQAVLKSRPLTIATDAAGSLVLPRAYTQPEYREHLAGWKLFDKHSSDTASNLPWFPPTNALWVFEKTA